jgi:hypothetical protein
MMNHGLINYNLKFFWMLARSNGYKWLYSNYVGAPDTYPIPENIVENVTQYNPACASTVGKLRISDSGIIVAMQKVFDIAFVPPIDVNTGSRTSNRSLARRYWTVFTPNAFDALENKTKNSKTNDASLLDRVIGRRLRERIALWK